MPCAGVGHNRDRILVFLPSHGWRFKIHDIDITICEPKEPLAVASAHHDKHWYSFVEESSGGGCFNGDARVLMADGLFKMAAEIAVGNALAGGTAPIIVEAHTVQASPCSPRRLVKLPEVNITISRPHRVQRNGKWLKPEDIPGATLVSFWRLLTRTFPFDFRLQMLVQTTHTLFFFKI